MGLVPIALASLWILLLVPVFGCDRTATVEAASAPASRPNILLVSIDTLRADHLGYAGYERPTSPVIDSLAARGTRYTRAFAPAPWTLPSHVAMLTGQHPARAGIVDVDSVIPEDVPIVAEPLAAAGYQTAAFVDSTRGGFVGAEHGFDRGFETYAHAPYGEVTWRKYDVAETVRVASEWLEARDPKRPFFLFVHTKSVHSLQDDESEGVPAASPYDAPMPFRWRFSPSQSPTAIWRSGSRERGVRVLMELNRKLVAGELQKEELRGDARHELVARYDAAIAYVDHQVGELLATLERLGLSDDTIVILTADHGEGFLDHRFFLHKELHREILRVPLIVYRPGDPPGRAVSTLVTLEDVAATILADAGIAPPPGLSGAPLPVGEAQPDTGEERGLFALSRGRRREFYDGLALRSGHWALIRDRVDGEESYDVRLYDLRSDPLEQSPVSGEPELEAHMTRELLEWFDEAATRDPLAIELPPETLEELRALGYID